MRMSAHDILKGNDVSDKQSILDDPRMGGMIWNAADEVTEGMLASWPVWETCGDPGSISLAPWVVHPSLREIRVADLVYWRPLRLPGMNAQGEIRAKDMRPEFFERVAEWQWRAPCTNADDGTHRWRAHRWRAWSGGHGRYGWVHVGQFDGEYWRPAIFARAGGEQLDIAAVKTGAYMRRVFEEELDRPTTERDTRTPIPPAGTLGDTIDAKRQLTEIRACKDCPCCYTPKGPRFDGDRMVPAPLAACSADPELVLDDRYLTKRHPDCKMVGKMASWPEDNDGS